MSKQLCESTGRHSTAVSQLLMFWIHLQTVQRTEGVSRDFFLLYLSGTCCLIPDQLLHALPAAARGRAGLDVQHRPRRVQRVTMVRRL